MIFTNFIDKNTITLRLKFVLLCFTLMILACGKRLTPDVKSAMKDLPEEIDFNLHVKPVLSDRCFACHGPDKTKQKAGLRLDLAESAYGELEENPGKFAIVPGKLSASQVYHHITSDDPEMIMPPPESDLSLTAYEIAILIKWIEQGAEYKPHWAFTKPVDHKLPEVEKTAWVKNPIDRFILHKLENKGWNTSEEAGKEELLRRVCLDLTGLPPSLAEMDSFLNDDSKGAYEKLVDRLLNSPHFGERMATGWMDVSRFADTHGYTVDRYRDMSPWRDWVIEAFNRNMPFDQFVIWQIAGDLLPDATKEQILATGFNRNHPQNMEGGIVEEEFRVEYVADRTNTLGTAFLGLTLECARCHDHKYDPISQEDYFRLYSFFNNVQEAGQISWDNATPVPTMLLTDEKLDEILLFLQDRIDQKNLEIEEITQVQQLDFEKWLETKKMLTSIRRDPSGLVAHYDFNHKRIANRLNPRQKGAMKQQGVSGIIQPVFTLGKRNNGLLLDGDAWLDLGTVGSFSRSEPFTIGIWAKIPSELKNGVLFHKGIGAALYNFRGFHVALRDNQLELLMAHTAPFNAIIKHAGTVPRDQWIQVVVTYDGSSKASGLRVYLNGQEQITKVESDRLYKSILFHSNGQREPGLQIGARWRGTGVKGAVVDDIMVFNRELSGLEVYSLFDVNGCNQLMKKPAIELNQEEVELLKQHFLMHNVPLLASKKRKLSEHRVKLFQTIDTIREIMVMQEMASPRQAFVLERGQYDAHGMPVSASVPELLLPMPSDLPHNRLGLAKWLMHPDHPLTSRVTINRFWQQLFGRGLVLTSEDFGNQGELPSNLELLDWLSVEFIRSGWDVKKLFKLLVTSATYRQSSKTTLLMAQEDPQNIYLSRGPSQRLTAEMLRDNVLSASGLLIKRIGGPSVKPAQPEGLWRINGGTYKKDFGENQYRRSLYTFWKRTVPHPTQATFDAPDRSNCTVRRQKTSTPLQALVLLNDPVYIEAAKAIGEQIAIHRDSKKGIESAFRQLTGRTPTDEELSLLTELQSVEKDKFAKFPSKAEGWLNIGDYTTRQKDLDQGLLAANTVVASTIMNLDATIVKR